ncbi:hypothetical protein DE146DRAFT_758241 [Phaeosphaeria sp. MPI-PUGE-AT-0046c]|nr:hypothetical protein DE146DRAFT_758241 [Phaeosphaeria sp. MPI-PUGE-AT-0046c]
MKNFLIAAVALMGTSMVSAMPIEADTSLVAAGVFDLGSSPATGSPSEVAKRARLGYTFSVRSGQLNKCAGAPPSCTFQHCFVPRLVDSNGNRVAGAVTTNDKDWNCAAIQVKSPEYARYNLKFTEVGGCNKPVSMGPVSYCFDGKDGRTVHFPGWGYDGKSGWCHVEGTDGVGTASCYVGF